MATKKDPFDDDDEDLATPDTTDEGDDEPKTVSTEPDPNDEEEEEEGAAPTGEWKKKKDNRFKAIKEEAEAERKKSEELSRQLNAEQAGRIAAETTARMVAESTRIALSPQNQPDIWKQGLDGVEKDRKAIMQEADLLKRDNKMDLAAQERLNLAWSETENRRIEILNHKAQTAREWEHQRTAPMREAQERARATEEQIKMRYPDIVSNPEATLYMNHTFMRAISAEKKPNNWTTADEIAAETRRRYRIGPPPAAGAATRARHAGIGGGSNGASSRGSKSVVMDKNLQKMAFARYPKLAKKDPKLALKKWAETIGKDLDDDGD